MTGDQHKQIAEEINKMVAEDQRVRKLYQEEGEQTPERFNSLVTPVDTVNEKRIEEIIDEYGWITISKFGKQTSFGTWLIVQHSNIDLQKKALILMEKYMNDIDVKNYAYLKDRVLLRENKKQFYGTQVSIDAVTKIPIILPTEDELNLNDRRKSIGLPPIEEYLQRFNTR
jgi:hypothetical protein